MAQSPAMLRARLQYDLPDKRLSLDQAVRRGGLLEGHDSVDADAQVAGRDCLDRAFDVGVIVARTTDDAYAPQVQAPHIKVHVSAAMCTGGDQTSAKREAVERTGPECRIGDIFEHDIRTVAVGDAHHFGCQI